MLVRRGTNKIEELNKDKNIRYIIQLPLPDQISKEKIINAIDPLKDVDGFNPVNVETCFIKQ